MPYNLERLSELELTNGLKEEVDEGDEVFIPIIDALSQQEHGGIVTLRTVFTDTKEGVSLSVVDRLLASLGGENGVSAAVFYGHHV